MKWYYGFLLFIVLIPAVILGVIGYIKKRIDKRIEDDTM